MQQEAARRVQRMQEHSRRVFEEHGGRPTQGLRTVPPPHREPPPPADSGLDGEQLLLLGLALLLFRSGCRMELVVALLYLAT